ncbi:hypothetical protein EYZ11_012675 [Aspergillus tanneri]|uniref:Phosphatidylserine decarboxylase n=1 Tax=Aspergillus tanneri TaxID=1220188 RepID=A0A4S3IZL5_9EURO|nr:uncharacterized protein ATNIH1004_006616 [Aspergillus tanneri]KAA8647914.1 hypothetical protein ATNIH1004_006616 [Aspergillus tanneri]THC87879.1 hypothetical protein EYZ11_012675 [Aspergillus tanneri]
MSHQPIVLELIDLIDRNKWQETFEEAIKKAREDPNAVDDLNSENIKDLKSFFKFIDSYVTWIPMTAADRDIPLKKLSIFYFILDKQPVIDLQTSVTEKKDERTELSDWVVKFANSLGTHMDSPDSISPSSIKTFRNNKDYSLHEYIPDNWQSFNEFFARRVKKQYRPITTEQKAIASPCDAIYDGRWSIASNGEVTFAKKSQSINFKGITWKISELLDDSQYRDEFNGGDFMHAFLLPHNYHRVHAPVGGKVVEVKTIPGNVYLEVGSKKHEGITPIRRMPSGDGNDVDAQDNPGYQWNQVRGLIVFDTSKDTDLNIGYVALFAVGMAQISSVVTSVTAGDQVGKGDEIGLIKYGGSDYVLVFQKDKIDFSKAQQVFYPMGKSLNIYGK